MLKRTRAVAIAAIATLVAVGMAGQASAAPGDPITVSGYVTDADGYPLSFRSVQVYGGSNFLGFASTDWNGYYEISGVSNTEVETLQVSSWPAVCEPLAPFSAPATLTSNCQVPTMWTVTVSGTAVTDNGAPVEGLWVQMESDTGAGGGGPIAADGTYAATLEVAEGTQFIYVYAPSDFGTPVATLTDIYDGADFTGVDFTFHVVVTEEVEFTVEGTITDKKGRPVAGAQVGFEDGFDGPSIYTETAADGSYTLLYPGFWVEESGLGRSAFISVNDEFVEYIASPTYPAPNVVNYQIGKSPVFEPFAMGLELTSWGTITDIYRKAGKDGVADWRVCSDTGGPCYGAEFGSKKTDIWEITPSGDFSGTSDVILREANGDGAYSWWALGEFQPNTTDAAVFGRKNFDGHTYQDVYGVGATVLVAWADRGGDTTVSTWFLGTWAPDEAVLPGKFAAIAFEDLNLADGPEMIVTTRKGNKYSVYLIEDPMLEPELIATGHGEPSIAYEDTDADGVLEVLVTYS